MAFDQRGSVQLGIDHTWNFTFSPDSAFPPHRSLRRSLATDSLRSLSSDSLTPSEAIERRDNCRAYSIGYYFPPAYSEASSVSAPSSSAVWDEALQLDTVDEDSALFGEDNHLTSLRRKQEVQVSSPSIRSLLVLCQEISFLKPIECVLRRNSLSITGKSTVLSAVVEELLRLQVIYSQSTQLCFEEMYIVLQRMKTSIEDSSNGSRLWLLMQIESVSFNFHELIAQLSILLEIFPINEFDLSEDVEELLILLRKQCVESKAFVDQRDDHLKREVLDVIEGIEIEIVPDRSRLKRIFEELGFRDSSSCRDEIEKLEEEIQYQGEDGSNLLPLSLIGLIRYAKCVLYGPSTPPKSDFRRHKSVSDVNVPAEFRCPITLELMRDPVVVSTGHTYDRPSIELWIESGHNTCPITGQTLTHTDLISNRALKNFIAMWCRKQKIPFDTAVSVAGTGATTVCKAEMEFTKMTVLFLIEKLSSSSTDDLNGVVHELRILSKSVSFARACIAEAGALPKLVRCLGMDVGLEHPNLQINAVTTILNLSILEANKTKIMETDGAANGVIEVLQMGATWEAKGNAAATLFSLSGVNAYKRRLGRRTRVVKGLIDLAKDGPTNPKRDALVAILNLSVDRDNVPRFVEGGVMEAVGEAIGELPEESVAVVRAVVRRGGVTAIAAAFNLIKKLGDVLREGNDVAREGAAAALVTMCRKGGSETVAEMAAVTGIERVVWELIGTGTARLRRKAASLMRYLRRWAAGLEHGEERQDNQHQQQQQQGGVGETHSIIVPALTRIFR